jgi:hypothetical protein
MERQQETIHALIEEKTASALRWRAVERRRRRGGWRTCWTG